MLTIVTAPHAVLSKKAKKVEKIDKAILSLVREMKVTLENTRDPEGVGLAAPQVGKSIRLFLMKPSKDAPAVVCVNPEIIAFEDKKATRKQKKARPQSSEAADNGGQEKKENVILEGCLSLPAIWGEVKRHDKTTLVYLDENGKKQQEIFSGFSSTIVQHECDHLQGILFPKLVLEQKNLLYRTMKNEKNETVFEEIKL